MDKIIICCIFCICISLAGCTSIPAENNGDTPQSTSRYLPVQISTFHPQGSKLYSDTMGLLEAFTKHEDLRALFEQAVSGSLSLDIVASNHYYYDVDKNAYCWGNDLSDNSLRVDEKTADAIRKILESLPGVHIRMLSAPEGKAGRMCVFFSIVKNTTGEDDGYYEEDLIYSSHDLSDMKQYYGYTEIGDGWWLFSAPMP